MLAVLVVVVSAWNGAPSAAQKESPVNGDQETTTATHTPAPTFTLVPTATLTPTLEPTATMTATLEPIATLTSTVEPTATSTPTVVPTFTPTATPTIDPPIDLVIQQASVEFGAVNAAGEIDADVAGVTSSVDEQGAYYVRLSAITLTVESSLPWTGTCRIDASIADRLEWRLSGTTEWIPFLSDAIPGAFDNACFPVRPIGATAYVYDLRLRVNLGDPEGPFAAAIGFAVES